MQLLLAAHPATSAGDPIRHVQHARETEGDGDKGGMTLPSKFSGMSSPQFHGNIPGIFYRWDDPTPAASQPNNIGTGLVPSRPSPSPEPNAP